MPESFWNKLQAPILALAPMEDVTDTVFRRLVASCGRPDVFFTEFASADGICSRGRDGVIHRLKYTEEERPLVAQIWGNKPENYYKAAQLIFEMGFDGIDINMGCPVHKIVKDGACSALVENQPLAQELICAAKEGAGGLPVSVKTRLGFRSWKTEEWTSFLLGLEPAVLTVHGRIAKDMSKKPARWDEIGRVVEIRDDLGVSTLVLGNGDVESLEDAYQKTEQYKVDGIMIGRGIFNDLFIFNRETTRPLRIREPQEKIDLLLQHCRLHRKVWEGQKPYKVLKKYFKIYVNGFHGASELRAQLMETNSLQEAEAVLATVPLHPDEHPVEETL